MAQLDSTITFKWWNDSKEIPETHISELEENALARISHMIQKGFIAGELSATIVNYPNENEKVEYRGSWEYRTVTKE
jgi:hypothetical protein